jgi:integrase-like protein
MKDSLWSVDLFRCESILLRSHWVMVVMDVFTRRIIGLGVERADPCGASICRMFNLIIAGKSLPRHLSSDHDPLFRFHRWLAHLRILEVEEIKSIPFVSVSDPFVERLIGTIRREFLDRVLIWNAVDLGRKLEEFRNYYNENRVHQSLRGSTPEERLANRRPPMPSWTTTLGGTTAAVCSRCRSQRNLRIRHGQAFRSLPAVGGFVGTSRAAGNSIIKTTDPPGRGNPGGSR